MHFYEVIMMKILIYGAGVIGSLYASRLYAKRKKIQEFLQEKPLKYKLNDVSSFEVKLLARGARYTSLQSEGVMIEHFLQHKRTCEFIPIIDTLTPDDYYDYIIVIMRKNQIQTILPMLNQNNSPNIVFLGNNGTGVTEYQDKLAKSRIILGFPSAGGRREGQIVKSIYREESPITIGEISGTITPRVQAFKSILEAANIQVKISENIDAWLKYHIALVSPLANGIYLAHGDNYALAQNRDAIRLMVKAIREGFKVLLDLNYPITPKYLKKKIYYIPSFLIQYFLKKLIGSEKGKLAMRDHAMAAPDEMRQIADEFQQIKKGSSIQTPSIDNLFEYLP